ncbi:MAG: exopolysaccharide biosynthesis polyprenyl glycosylphosphotransferase [Bacteroidetes bacterium]|nr:exopolysaccharide biosynthesis polyprenyl glycosylphosphotransferase [Bacteroidota bacterium]
MARYERYIYLALELVVLVGSFALAVYIRRGTLVPLHSPLLRLMLGCAALIWVIISLIGAFRPMDRRITGIDFLKDLISSLVTAMVGTFAVGFMVGKTGIPVGLIATYFVIFTLAVGLARFAIWKGIRAYRKAGYNFKRIVILGSNSTSDSFIHELEEHPEYGYKVVARFTFDGDKQAPGQLPAEEFEAFVTDKQVDQAYVVTDKINWRVLGIIRYCFMKNIRVLFINQMVDHLYQAGFRAYLDESGMTTLVAVDPVKYKNLAGRWAKRAFDIVFSLLVVLLVMPLLFPIVALLVKLSSPGPVLFIQERTGLVDRPFGCLKFRTMRVNADSDRKQAVKGDPRITRIGHFLRKSNLDELPQFFNVLMGHMSVVGPRPHMVAHTEEYTKLIGPYKERLWLKPGITGLAQAKGLRGETKELLLMERRVATDRSYIRNWSFSLDLYIIMLTIWNMMFLKRQGA